MEKPAERVAAPPEPKDFASFWASTNNEAYFSNKPITSAILRQVACESWQAKSAALQAKVSTLEQSLREIEDVVFREIVSSTGPTGGWLDSPKAVHAAMIGAIRAHLAKLSGESRQ